MNDYEAKQEARRQRYEERAEAARQEAHDRFNGPAGRTLSSMMGEPIKVGHHSERRHRKLFEKADNEMRKGSEALAKAKHYEQKAAGVGTGGISADDPDAISKLRAKLRQMEGQRELMKAANKAYRMAKKKGINGLPDDELLANDVEAIQEAIGRGSFEFAKKAIQWMPSYSFEKGPYTGWPLSNLGQNIKRVERRIKDLEAAGTREGKTINFNDGTVFEEHSGDNRVRFYFDGKPPVEVRDVLKRYGFRWARSIKAWQRQATANGRGAADMVIQALGLTA